MTRFLITGATGFIGSHLVRALVSHGEDVHVIVRSSSDLAHLGEIRDCVSIYTDDGSTDGMIEIARKAGPDIVINLAALFLAAHKSSDVVPLVNANVVFGARLLESMARTGVDKLVNISTTWRHYRDASYDPVCLYAATKHAFEALAAYYVSAEGMKMLTLEFFDTYGPRDSRAKLFALLRRAAADNEPIDMSPGEQIIDLVYIDDALSAISAAASRLLQNKVPNMETFVVSGGQPKPLREIVELYAETLGRRISVRWGARKYREREVMTPWVNGTPLPGWSPRVSLSDGFRRMEEDHV